MGVVVVGHIVVVDNVLVLEVTVIVVVVHLVVVFVHVVDIVVVVLAVVVVGFVGEDTEWVVFVWGVSYGRRIGRCGWHGFEWRWW